MIYIRLYSCWESALYDFNRWVEEHSGGDAISETDEKSLTVGLKDGNRMMFLTDRDFMKRGGKNRSREPYELVGREPPGLPLFPGKADSPQERETQKEKGKGEEDMRMHVGEEVVFDDFYTKRTGVVIKADEENAVVYDTSGAIQAHRGEVYTKTGRFFPGIAQLPLILEMMRKGDYSSADTYTAGGVKTSVVEKSGRISDIRVSSRSLGEQLDAIRESLGKLAEDFNKIEIPDSGAADGEPFSLLSERAAGSDTEETGFVFHLENPNV